MNDAIIEKDTLFYQAFYYAPIGMALVSIEGNWLKVNPSLCEITGYSEEELLKKTFHEITHPEDIEMDLEQLHQLLNGDIVRYKIEKRYIHKNEHDVWVFLSVSLVRDDEGQPLYFITQIKDISERKKEQFELRRIQEMYQLISENAQDLITYSTPDGICRYVSPAITWLLGYKPEDVVGRPSVEFWHPEDIATLTKREFADIDTFICRVRHLDGRYIWFETTMKIIRDTSGDIVYVVGIGRDITARIESEKKLRESEESLVLAQEIAGLGSWDWDLQTNRIKLSQNMYRILGVEPTESDHAMEAGFSFVHPEELDRFRHEFWNLKNKESFELEYRIIRADGEERYLYTQGKPLYDQTFTPIRIIGTVLDITDRIVTERLQEENRQMELELNLASSIQQSLLPKIESIQIPERCELGIVSIAARKLNGDFYNAAKIDDTFTFGVADISGKGIPAAILMSMLKFAMDEVMPVSNVPSVLMDILNRFVDRYSDASTFVTMFMGSYNEKTSVLTYSCAGHEPAILYRSGTKSCEELSTDGIALGIHKHSAYKTCSVRLEPGDMILLYTDGIIENRTNRDIDTNIFLKEALQVARQSDSAQEIVESILVDIRTIQRECRDDQTLLLFRINELSNT